MSQVKSNYFLLFLVRRKILNILDSIDFSQEIPEPLQLDFFDRTQIEQVIANCEHKSLRGQTVCNVKVRVALKYISAVSSGSDLKSSETNRTIQVFFLIETLVY